jgi:ABC-2 type transport system permease protein
MIRKTWAVTKKEMLHITRSAGTLFLVTASPVVMLVLMAYAFAADIKRVPIAVYDQDLTPLSRTYVSALVGGPDLVLTGYVDSLEAVDRLLEHSTIRAAVIIQNGFEKAVETGDSVPVQVIVDGTEPESGGFAYEHIVEHTVDFVEGRLRNAALARGVPEKQLTSPLDLRTRIWYNPGLDAVQDVVPALIAVILSLPAVSLSAAIAREKEHGSLEQLIASPISKFALLAGKVLPYVLIGVLDVFLSLAVSKAVFGVYFRGSLLLLLLFSVDYFVASLAIALIISIYSRTQRAAMALAILFFLFPGLFLSGIFFPLIAMPPEMQMEANLLPSTQFVAILRGLFLKGVGFDILWGYGLALLVMGLVFGAFAVLRFQKKLV